MKKITLVFFLSAGMGLGMLQYTAVAGPAQVTAAVSSISKHPTEEKYDRIMEKYAVGLKTAFAEKDDKKAIVIINKTTNEFITEIEKIKPELERWVKGLTEKDKEELEKRAGEKAYLKTIFEIMFDPEVGKRLEQNPELKKALDAGNERMQALGFEDDSTEEEEIEEEVID